MKKELAERLVQVMSDCGEEAELYERYSGRGMFGETTTGVVVESIATLLARVIECAHEFVDHDDEIHDSLYAGDHMNFKLDTLGRDMIIY